jgi:hypothetical protein
VKARLFSAIILFPSCAGAFAQTYPIIDLRYGYLIGAIQNGKWIESDSAKKSVRPGMKLQVYGITGVVGTVSVVKLDTQNEPCEDRPTVKVNPKKVKQGAVAFAANWNPLPRKPNWPKLSRSNMLMLSANSCASADCAIQSCRSAKS